MRVASPPEPVPDKPPATSPSGVQELLLGWCLWLLISWGVVWGLDSRVPAARWMFFACATGLMLIWPTFRLSQGEGRVPREQGEAESRTPRPQLHSAHGVVWPALFDWLCLLTVFQAVLWPLRLSGAWPIGQTLWLDATLGAWTLLAAAFVAAGRFTTHAGGRLLAMIGCIALLLGEPVIRLALTGHIPVHMAFNPLHDFWSLTSHHMVRLLGLSTRLIVVAAVAVAAWVGLFILSTARSTSHRTPVFADPQEI